MKSVGTEEAMRTNAERVCLAIRVDGGHRVLVLLEGDPFDGVAGSDCIVHQHLHSVHVVLVQFEMARWPEIEGMRLVRRRRVNPDRV